MSRMTEPAWAIERIGPDRHPEAVAGLLPHAGRANASSARRFLDYARQNNVPLDAMWSLTDAAGAIKATVLGVPSPGSTAMLFASLPRNPQESAAIARLIDHACRGLRERNVELAQALLDPGDAVASGCFAQAHFTMLANLSYMERPIRTSDARLAADLPEPFAIEPYADTMRAELVDLLEQTYIDTLDCPGLVGLRDAKDILIGHESVGDMTTRIWLLLRMHGSAAGIVMLNPSPANDTIELVYLGLAPAARGKGVGVALLRAGLAQLANRRERSVTLAVDQQNSPAMTLYSREGFKPVLERVAMIRSLRDL